MTRWLLPLAFLVFGVPVLAADVDRKRDVIYGRKHGVCLTMDVFTPKENSKGIGVIVVVSGGWKSSHGEIDSGAKFGEEFVKRGYTLFAVVHGSQPKYSIPECIDDLHRSVRFIRHNAREFGIDPDRIGITGASAGCHLSLMMGVAGKPGDPKAKDPVDRASSAVQAVAGFFPPTDFFNYGQVGKTAEGLTRAGPFSPAFDFRERDAITQNWKPVTDAKRKELLRQISPINFVTAKTPPVRLIHGDADFLVPLQQSEIMIAKLKECGVACDLIVREQCGHGWKGIENDVPKLVEWFDVHLKK